MRREQSREIIEVRSDDRFVRSLNEREDHPERTTDLGAPVGWILEHHGFEIRQYPYKYDGVEPRVSKGRLQHGIDILAAR